MRRFHTLVVGAGPAGIAAAVRAAESGASVGVIDDNPAPGGQIWRGSSAPLEHSGMEDSWRRRLSAAHVTLLQGWSVFDQIEPGVVRAERQGEAADFAFEKLVLANGARERFLPFPGWTLPNVMGAGALQAMIKCGLPIRGKRVVVAGSGPLLLAVAAFLKRAGAVVLCVCEQATASSLFSFAASLVRAPAKIVEGVRYQRTVGNVPFYTSAWPVQAHGDFSLRSVELAIRGKPRVLKCDYLACGFHLVPNTELAALLGCEARNGSLTVDDWQRTTQDGIYAAGEVTGVGGLELSLVEGEIAGFAATGHTTEARKLFGKREKLRRFAGRLDRAFALRRELKSLPNDETTICRCEDVTYGAVSQHQSWRSAKLHTRCGMGPCQGRVCGAATSFLFGWDIDRVRPPILPSRIASLQLSSDIHQAEENHL